MGLCPIPPFIFLRAYSISYTHVIISPSPVILNEVKNLAFPLRINSVKNLVFTLGINSMKKPQLD